MSNQIIQSLWVGKELSNNELMCVHSYLRHGHHFHLYTYDGINRIPAGVEVRDANEILPASALFTHSAYSYASFADWFRLRLLFIRGGWWVDMDTVCMRPFDIPEAYCFSSERHYSLTKEEISNTFMKAPAGDVHIGRLLAMVETRISEQQGRIQWGDLGVFLLRKELEQLEVLRPYVRPPAVFCPLDYFNLSDLICPGDYQPGPETFAIHLWNEIWKRGNLDKNAIYHPDSLYERLKLLYLKPMAEPGA